MTAMHLAEKPDFLRHASVAELAAIRGASLKTAKIFCLHSRPNEQHAVLDTHILAWLRELGIANVPRATPGNWSRYDRLERVILEICRATGCSPAKLDLATWTERHRPERATRKP